MKDNIVSLLGILVVLAGGLGVFLLGMKHLSEGLQAVEGDFTPSELVKGVTGVDNVCERAAVLASGGQLIKSKYAQDGVTFALAEETACFDWSW